MGEWKKQAAAYKKWLFPTLIAVQFLIILFFIITKLFFLSGDKTEADQLDPLLLAPVVETADEEQAESHFLEKDAIWMVDIKGQVAIPGVYCVEQEMRIGDVVEMAGGLKEHADVRRLNLAQAVADQMMIYIPSEGETEADQLAAEAITPGLPTEKEQEKKININTADTMELQQLDGIGAKKADKIIAYREETGFFKKIEDLMEVSGIGEKTFENLKEKITVAE